MGASACEMQSGFAWLAGWCVRVFACVGVCVCPFRLGGKPVSLLSVAFSATNGDLITRLLTGRGAGQ